MPPKAKSPSAKDSSAHLGFEAKLWTTADRLRNNMDAAESKHVVLGLIFLKHISDTFEDHRAKLLAAQGATFRRDLHPDLRANFVIANPPFNDSETALRDRAFLQNEAKMQVVSEAKDNFRNDDDVRWQFGVPPKGNANFDWVQHFIRHLAANLVPLQLC